MGSTVTNRALFEKKLDDLHWLQKNFHNDDFPFTFACSYHGVHLQFKSRSQFFTDELHQLLPADWRRHEKNGEEIYIISPGEFGFTPESFSEEAEQDCFTLNENTIAIQRDFASVILADKVLLICDERIGDGFYNFLRWYLSEKLMEHNSYVIHSSCVLDKAGCAHVFLGHSNAGKTTITELSSPRLVLGDDMNLLSVDSGRLRVEAGAIGGRYNSMIGYGKKVSVKTLYWLNQAKENKKILLDRTAANQKLLASFANLNWNTLDFAKIESLMSFAESATRQVPFYQLDFVKDKSIWEFLDP